MESVVSKRVDYRKLALQHYDHLCACCGFGITDVLEVAHVDGDRKNNRIENLIVLCPNCHKMHDLDLIPTDMMIALRDRPKVARWAKRMKDAGARAAATRKSEREKRLAAGAKAATTRKRRAAAKKAVSTRRRRAGAKRAAQTRSRKLGA